MARAWLVAIWRTKGWRSDMGIFLCLCFDLKAGLGIQTISPLATHDLSSLAQLQIDHAGPVAAMTLRQSDDLFFQSAVVVAGRFVA